MDTPDARNQASSRTSQKITMNPLNIYEHEFQVYFRRYMNKISEVQRNNFKEVDFLSTQETHFFQFNKGKDQLGLAVVYLDKDYHSRRRLLIGHFSVIQEEHLEYCFETLVNYIFEHDKCSEIRLGLRH